MDEITIFEHHDAVAEFVNSRCNALGLRGNKRLDAIAHITVGAVSMIDELNKKAGFDASETCVSPLILFSIMRGDDWTKEWERIKSQSQSSNQTSGGSGSEKDSL